MNQFFTNLKKQAEENPVVALGVAAAAITAGAKLLDTVTAISNSRTHKKEVNRRIKNANKK